jgi:hypothetical protein
MNEQQIAQRPFTVNFTDLQKSASSLIIQRVLFTTHEKLLFCIIEYGMVFRPFPKKQYEKDSLSFGLILRPDSL